MTDAVAESAPFDVRYMYLAGGLADGNGTCNSCDSSCTAGGVSCGTQGSACGWWGCWQDVSVPPGQYVRDLLSTTYEMGQIPMITYYEILQTSGVTEGAAEVTTAANDTALMTRFFNDFRFLLQQLGARTAFVHVEPDFWGYAEKLNQDPHQLAAAVAKANPTDCAAQEDSIAGLGRCVIAMARAYAPNVKIGLHASAWGTGNDAMQNRDPSFDIAADAQKLADFLIACGAGDADFVGVDASDRDAGYYRSIGQQVFWDATDATLPNFKQAFAWTQALTERLGKPALWWQLPLGNMSLPDVNLAWQDNRVDYFFSHPADVARTNAIGMLFGAGESHQTNPSSDGGNFVRKAQALAAAGGQPACF